MLLRSRGRGPSRDVRLYITIVVVNERSKGSLRYVEDNYRYRFR
ncbi:MAG: hypothetical protein NXY59_00065 [Aigarchaeota archaeon]|nr:hypothetical protein [Candidatus Pelearchaeum maunauluense]